MLQGFSKILKICFTAEFIITNPGAHPAPVFLLFPEKNILVFYYSTKNLFYKQNSILSMLCKPEKRHISGLYRKCEWCVNCCHSCFGHNITVFVCRYCRESFHVVYYAPYKSFISEKCAFCPPIPGILIKHL